MSSCICAQMFHVRRVLRGRPGCTRLGGTGGIIVTSRSESVSLPHPSVVVWSALRDLQLTTTDSSCCSALSNCGQFRGFIPCSREKCAQPHTFVVQGGALGLEKSSEIPRWTWKVEISVDEIRYSSTELRLLIRRNGFPRLAYPLLLLDALLVVRARRKLVEKLSALCKTAQFYHDHRNRWPKP
jgi:hypothetical protein